MNIHWYNGTRISTEEAKKRGLVTKGRTLPPRTREGKAYPGGKGLRKAFTRLHARRNGESGPGKLPDRLSRGAQKQGNYYLPAETLPGSMKA